MQGFSLLAALSVRSAASLVCTSILSSLEKAQKKPSPTYYFFVRHCITYLCTHKNPRILVENQCQYNVGMKAAGLLHEQAAPEEGQGQLVIRPGHAIHVNNSDEYHAAEVEVR